jgi:hypothetical protein
VTLFGARMVWMPPRRFAWTLRARGPGVADWPAAERTGALCLLRRNAAARELLAEALSAEDAPGLDPAMLARITCPVQRALAPLTPFMRGIRWGAVAACLVAGAYVGVLRLETDTAADTVSAVFSATSATVLAALEQ